MVFFSFKILLLLFIYFGAGGGGMMIVATEPRPRYAKFFGNRSEPESTENIFRIPEFRRRNFCLIPRQVACCWKPKTSPAKFG